METSFLVRVTITNPDAKTYKHVLEMTPAERQQDIGTSFVDMVLNPQFADDLSALGASQTITFEYVSE